MSRGTDCRLGMSSCGGGRPAGFFPRAERLPPARNIRPRGAAGPGATEHRRRRRGRAQAGPAGGVPRADGQSGTASAATRRGARAQWGAILNALPHPIQVLVRGTPATTLPVVERIKAHGSPQAQDLAAWLSAHLHGAQLVARERFLVVPAEDIETLSDRCASLEASMRQIGLPMERLTSPDELCVVLSGFLTPRPRRFGPAIVDVSASDHLIADGLFRAAFDLG